MLPKYDLHAMRLGWWSDKYFLNTQQILMKDNYSSEICYQYFPRKDNIVICGINHVIDIFKNCTGYYSDRNLAWEIFQERQKINIYNLASVPEISKYVELTSKLNSLWFSKFYSIKMFTVEEGYIANNMEPIIGIIGNPKDFAHLETPTLGILAQQSAVATSVNNAKKAMTGNGKYSNRKLLFFPARFRHYNSQSADGYAAMIGGAFAVSTDSNGEYWGYDGQGTAPHLLIAAYNGITSLAALKFDEHIDQNINRIMLVDWDNDCILTTLNVVISFIEKSIIHSYPMDQCEYFLKKNRIKISNVIGEGKGKLYGVRFDTSGQLTDKRVNPWNENGKGVSKELVYKARAKFNELGLRDLKIMISGGFDEEKLKKFEDVPYDLVGIGSSIVNKFSVDFTADSVMTDGYNCSKIGRQKGDWSNLKLIS